MLNQLLLVAVLLPFAAAPACAQTVPFDKPDIESQETSEYLDQQIRELQRGQRFNTRNSSFTGTTTFSGPVEFDKHVLFSSSTENRGTEKHTSTATYTLNATSPTVANALYGNTIIKAWAYFDGDTSPYSILAGVNVSSITRVNTGQYAVNWATDFNSDNYLVACNCGTTAAFFCGPVVAGLKSYQAFIECRNWDGTLADAPTHVLAVGAQ